jgi:molecular chaperone GrpE
MTIMTHEMKHTDDTIDQDANGEGAIQEPADVTAQGDGDDGEPASAGGAAGVRSGDQYGDDAESDLQGELEQQRDKYLRLAAEYDNYRRRTTKERAEGTTRAQAALVKDMIETLDDLSRFTSLDPAGTDAATVIQGVSMVDRKLLKVLTAAGLEVVDPLDKAFDPAVHEAVATEPAASEEEDGLVGRVYQPGYTFGGQLLRPARVVVRQWNG